jgi:hypothetical protein
VKYPIKLWEREFSARRRNWTNTENDSEEETIRPDSRRKGTKENQFLKRVTMIKRRKRRKERIRIDSLTVVGPFSRPLPSLRK